MNTETSVPKKHQWLFWIILAAFSTFFAEVFSGSDMFPFFTSWGLLVVAFYIVVGSQERFLGEVFSIPPVP